MDYYNFETPVTSDITLTAVWNDVINPNEPTLTNLKKALDMEIAQTTYPVGTEISHTDLANKDNPWVIKHYGQMPMAVGESIVNTFGAILGLKYAESAARYWSNTASNANYIPNVFTQIFNALPEDEKPFFSEVQSTIYGIHNVFFPTVNNLTFASDEVWQYYGSAEHFLERTSLFGTLSSNPTSGAPSSMIINAERTALNYFSYWSGVAQPTTRNFGQISVSTSTGTNLYAQYCVFVAASQGVES